MVAAQKVKDDREGEKASQDEDDEDHHEGGDVGRGVVDDQEDDVDIGRDLINQLPA